MIAKMLNTPAPTERDEDHYPLANTRACRMFAEGLAALEKKHGVSQRTLATQLGYKSSVVISHMASGRAPIPVERSMDFVRSLSLDAPEFLLAVLEQRFPAIPFGQMLAKGSGKQSAPKGVSSEEILMIEDLQAASGQPLADMPPEQFAVMREAAADRNAVRRWASVPEMGILDIFRQERPDVLRNGLSLPQRKALKEAVKEL